jgi:RNA polymerase sigma factor (TIGR02999 family)
MLNHQDTKGRRNTTCCGLKYPPVSTKFDPERFMAEITQLLQRVKSGDADARDALFAAAYPSLQKLARSRLRDGGRHTMLDTHSLVHESYLHFVQAGQLRAEDRRAFFAYASQIMRSVIVNNARERSAQKRGDGWRPLTLSTRISEETPDGEDIVLQVHDALESLAQVDERLAQVVQMRYFGGYSEREIAETLDITERTVQRLWLKARLILLATMQGT